MALSRTARATMSRSEIVAYHLRRMAKRIDPITAHYVKLAEEIGVHQTTMSDWIAQGYVPHFQCKKLHRRFGKLAPLDDLCPVSHRPQ